MVEICLKLILFWDGPLDRWISLNVSQRLFFMFLLFIFFNKSIIKTIDALFKLKGIQHHKAGLRIFGLCYFPSVGCLCVLWLEFQKDMMCQGPSGLSAVLMSALGLDQGPGADRLYQRWEASEADYPAIKSWIFPRPALCSLRFETLQSVSRA